MNGIRARFALPRAEFSLQVDATIPGRGVTALFGPSGSGKTTLLRCIAGLERAPKGYLAVNGDIWQDEQGGRFLPPHRRPLGFVFQDARLFPHLSVRRNLAFGRARVPRAVRRIAFDQAVEWLGLERLLERRPGGLSGGEKQRVAIARALLTGPRLLILDEPLASLDAASKLEILPYLERLHGELAIPVIFVSHALEEVAHLADHMVLLKEGGVLAAGPLAEVVTRLDLPLSHLDEAGTVIDAVVASHDETFQLTYLDFPGGRISAVRQPFPPGHAARVRILAKDVSLALGPPEGTSILNVFPAEVTHIVDHNPAQVLVRLAVGEVGLLSRITRKSASLLQLVPGSRVYAQVKSVALT